ncbi:hypothetical protein B0O99DRAFT_681476 [Bisporella sp. PMI_857]|nr:hypothetical protein B0O99DRAFT_681476 [Bisporella sp. PMI_857]
MVIAMLRANPLPVQGSQRKLYSPCWMNGRRYLLPESKPYTPICLGFSPILFPDLQEFSLNQQSTSAEIKAALLKACRIATSESQEATSYLAREQLSPSQSTAEPFFLSDGITEQYIAYTYPSIEDFVFEVNDITFAAYAEQNLIVRLSSWRGRSTISGEWRSSDYDSGTIVQFLEDVVRIMLSICED